MVYSIIVAVYNRPDEMEELLESLTKQTFKDFEVVVVEDGSEVKSDTVCDAYSSQLSIRYFEKSNSGPGPSRNYGCERAEGNVFIFLDSDCMVPEHWLEAINQRVSESASGRTGEMAKLDAFGGPDREHPSFSPIQKRSAMR